MCVRHPNKCAKNIQGERYRLWERERSDAVVCSDVVGPITPVSKSGLKYIVAFIMMDSRYVMIYPLHR